MRRVNLDGRLTGKQRSKPQQPAVVSLRYDGYRLRLENGLVSIQVMPEWIARELAHNWQSDGWKSTAVPAYEETITQHNDFNMEIYVEWGFPRQRHYLLFGKSRYAELYNKAQSVCLTAT